MGSIDTKVKNNQGYGNNKNVKNTGLQQRHYWQPVPNLPEDLTGTTFITLRPVTFKKTINRLPALRPSSVGTIWARTSKTANPILSVVQPSQMTVIFPKIQTTPSIGGTPSERIRCQRKETTPPTYVIFSPPSPGRAPRSTALLFTGRTTPPAPTYMHPLELSYFLRIMTTV